MDSQIASGGVSGWRPSVLVVDDEWSTLERIKRSLSGDFEVVTAARVNEAVRAMADRVFDVVLTDLRMPDRDGLSMVSEFRESYPDTQYILMTAFTDIDDTISALRLGVTDYLRKPFTEGEVRQALTRCLAHRQLSAELATTEGQPPSSLAELVTRAPAMAKVMREAQTVAATNANVLINGETGTGKGLLARALHNASARRHKPFVEINCAAIPATLIESELFGHEKGSFTGALARKMGRVELANSGTLFLDEVGEMPLDMQAKLLRFVQEFTFERVGGTKTLKTDLRVVAATNRDLGQAVREKLFRQDLFYRLHVINLVLPPLRDRQPDILLLADHFLARFKIKYNKPLTSFSEEARRQFLAHDWPGNVRELANVVERAVILAGGGVIHEITLTEEAAPPPPTQNTAAAPATARPTPQPAPPVSKPSLPPPPWQAGDGQTLSEYLAKCEQHFLDRTLAHQQGSIKNTAAACGVDTKTLYRKMAKHGLAKEDYRPRPNTGQTGRE